MAGSARVKRNWDALEGKTVPPDRWREFTLDERKVFVLLRAVSPPPSPREIADELDLTLGEVQEMIDRWEMRTLAPAARVPVTRFLKLIDSAAEQVLLAIDRKRLDGADLKSLTGGLRELINARALLLGEPTQITGSAQRMQLNEAATMVLLEARRRGITIDVDPATGALVTRRPVTIDAQGRPA
jgi:DNA-binding MarR family transcriptional regulator